jgi:hypothetical protein
MVPVHDTDIAEERWSKEDWTHYELWEEVEVRLRRRKVFFVLGAIALFLLFSAVPIVMERYPKWHSLSLARRLSQTIGQLKKQAAIEHQAFRLTFRDEQSLEYTVEKAASCLDLAPLPTGTARLDSKDGGYVVLTPSQGKDLGIPGLIRSFCYDSLSGYEATLNGENLEGFAIIPVKDLTDHRLDRVSYVLLRGPSAEVSFD